MEQIQTVIQKDFIIKKKINFLGVKTIISDIKDFNNTTKMLLLGIAIISIFLSFFDINHFINKANDPSVWSIKNQLSTPKEFLGSMPKWIDATLFCLSGVVSFTGILNVYLTCFGKISGYFWGIINVIVMSLFSFDYGYTGEAQINLFIYLPFQFIGWYMWKDSMVDGKNSSGAVATRKTNGYVVITIALLAVAIVAVAWYYEIVWFHKFVTNQNYDYAGKNQKVPHSFDSIENSLGVVGIVCQSLRLKEQWFLWFISDVMMLIMYCGGSSIGSNAGISINLNIIIQTSMFIGSCFIGWFIWSGKLNPDDNWFIKKQNNQEIENKLNLL